MALCDEGAFNSLKYHSLASTLDDVDTIMKLKADIFSPLL